MFKHYFEQIDNVEVYPIFSFILFFVFFIILAWRVLRMKPGYIEEIEKIPLEKEKESTNQEPINKTTS